MRTGDLVRWSRQSWMAFEKVEKAGGSQLFLEETPSDTFEDIGGLDDEIDRVKQTIRLHVERPDLARRYDVQPPKSLLLVGPPGTGKTMIARALANWLGTLSATGRSRFMNIPPGGLHSMWYSQSESNYREAFRVARDASATDPAIPVVMFFDEVDAIGGARGASLMRLDDRVLNAFMTELDGLAPRGNVLVVAATNRLAALDPALVRPGRLGDLRLTIPRPRSAGARAILAKHLPAVLPYDGDEAGQAREQLLDAAIARLYAPNGGTAVATLMFRDGKRRVVEARELVNGAVLANIGRSARAAAWAREFETGAAGIRSRDVLDAVDHAIGEMSAVLTPANSRNHLADLPDDVDVVRVDVMRRKSARTHRYMRVA
jgi:proteasome-associated ATPase